MDNLDKNHTETEKFIKDNDQEGNTSIDSNYVPNRETVIGPGNIRLGKLEDNLDKLTIFKINSKILTIITAVIIVIGLSGYFISSLLISNHSKLISGKRLTLSSTTSPSDHGSSTSLSNHSTSGKPSSNVTSIGSSSSHSTNNSLSPNSSVVNSTNGTTTAGNSPSPASSPPPSSDISPPANAFIITNYGASVSSADNTVAIQTAINDAGAVDGVVYIPSGIFKVAGSLRINSTITLEGQDRANSQLVETSQAVDLLSDSANNTIINNITLNTQTYNGGHAFGTTANNTLLEHSNIYSGSTAGHFALYYAGPSGSPAPTPSAPRYSVGNQLNDIVESDEICDDGISWSFQENGSITNVSQTGSRLALYVDYGDTITNYIYHPGVQTTTCPGTTQGFWITPPSQNVTINGFLSYGNGGELSSESAHSSTNININDETLVNQSGYKMGIGDVNGLTITNSNFGSDNTMVFDPQVAAQNVLIKNTSLANIQYGSSLSKINLTCITVSPVTCQ